MKIKTWQMIRGQVLPDNNQHTSNADFFIPTTKYISIFSAHKHQPCSAAARLLAALLPCPVRVTSRGPTHDTIISTKILLLLTLHRQSTKLILLLLLLLLLMLLMVVVVLLLLLLLLLLLMLLLLLLLLLLMLLLLLLLLMLLLLMLLLQRLLHGSAFAFHVCINQRTKRSGRCKLLLLLRLK